MKLKTLLLEYNDKVATYSNELGAYIKILKPKIKGWSFDVERMSGAWEWNHPKFEDAVYATWGWEGENNRIPYESSDGAYLGIGKLKLTPPKGGLRSKGQSKDEKEMKKPNLKIKIKIKSDLKSFLHIFNKLRVPSRLTSRYSSSLFEWVFPAR